MKKEVLLRLVLAAICSAAILCGGCSKEITVTQYPSFYTPELKTLAVVPFRNSSGDNRAGLSLSDSLAAALMANGTYSVFNRNDLSTLMDERDLQIAMGSDSSAAAAKFRQVGKVQMILSGTVTTYAATTRTEQRQEPQYVYDNKGNPVFMGYRNYAHTRNEANVVVTAQLIDVAGGAPIYSTSAPVEGAVAVEGSPPSMDPHACLANACRAAVNQLVAEIAVTHQKIKVNEKKDFRTASELYDDEWTYQNKFSPTDDKMYVVLRLPKAADRNRFRIVVVRKDAREELAAQDIVWDAKYGTFGYMFSPSQIAAAGGGVGDYTIKLYSGPKPVLTNNFKIVEPKKD